MTVAELKEVLADLPDEMPVCVIFMGEIDKTPSWNVDDDCVYIEGVKEN